MQGKARLSELNEILRAGGEDERNISGFLSKQIIGWSNWYFFHLTVDLA